MGSMNGYFENWIKLGSVYALSLVGQHRIYPGGTPSLILEAKPTQTR